MSRPSFFEPAPGELRSATVYDALLLAAPQNSLPPVAEIWTPLELLVAFDWAMRVHLNASDNRVGTRPRPFFTVRKQPCPPE